MAERFQNVFGDEEAWLESADDGDNGKRIRNAERGNASAAKFYLHRAGEPLLE